MRNEGNTPRQWYREGLEFGCTRCGDCCRGEPGFVWVTPAEMKRIAEFLRLPVKEFKRRYCRRVVSRTSLVELQNGDCIFWEGQCKIYEVRPKQCRTFPFWSHNVADEDSWEWLKTRCPGCGRGRHYTYEEIQDILNS